MNMPQNVGSIEDMISKTTKQTHSLLQSGSYYVKINFARHQTRHRKDPKQSRVVVVDGCFAILVANQYGATNTKTSAENDPLTLSQSPDI